MKLNLLQGYQLLKSFVQMGSSHSKWIFSEVIIAFLMLFHESLNPASFLSCKGVCYQCREISTLKKRCLQKAVNRGPIKNCNAFYVNNRDNNKQTTHGALHPHVLFHN